MPRESLDLRLVLGLVDLRQFDAVAEPVAVVVLVAVDPADELVVGDRVQGLLAAVLKGEVVCDDPVVRLVELETVAVRRRVPDPAVAVPAEHLEP